MIVQGASRLTVPEPRNQAGKALYSEGGGLVWRDVPKPKITSDVTGDSDTLFASQKAAHLSWNKANEAIQLAQDFGESSSDSLTEINDLVNQRVSELKTADSQIKSSVNSVKNSLNAYKKISPFSVGSMALAVVEINTDYDQVGNSFPYLYRIKEIKMNAWDGYSSDGHSNQRGWEQIRNQLPGTWEFMNPHMPKIGHLWAYRNHRIYGVLVRRLF